MVHFPRFSTPRSDKTLLGVKMFPRCKNGTELLSYNAKYGEAGTSPSPESEKDRCLFFVFRMVELVLTTSSSRHLTIGTVLILLDRGRFVVVHPHSTLFLGR